MLITQIIPEIIARQACTHSPWKFQNWRIEIEEFSWMFFLFSIWGLILGKFRAKECYVVSFQVRIFQWPLPQISSDNQVCHESNVLTGNHKSILYKLIIYYLPWVPEVFSCVWRGASSATGRGHARARTRAGHFLRLEWNRKPRMKSLLHFIR